MSIWRKDLNLVTKKKWMFIIGVRTRSENSTFKRRKWRIWYSLIYQVLDVWLPIVVILYMVAKPSKTFNCKFYIYSLEKLQVARTRFHAWPISRAGNPVFPPWKGAEFLFFFNLFLPADDFRYCYVFLPSSQYMPARNKLTARANAP